MRSCNFILQFVYETVLLATTTYMYECCVKKENIQNPANTKYFIKIGMKGTENS